jgi:hypothetical protein
VWIDGPATLTMVESSRSMMFAPNTTANTIQPSGLRVIVGRVAVGVSRAEMLSTVPGRAGTYCTRR